MKGFLISFMVDATGGVVQSQRHQNMKVYVPPGAVEGPTRIILHVQRKELYSSLPNTDDGEALACRIIRINSSCSNLNLPILFEIPHNASLRENERELIVLQSDNGEKWKYHIYDNSDTSMLDVIKHAADDLPSTILQSQRGIHRIFISRLSQFLSVITRYKQDSTFIGPDGGTVTSSLSNDVHATFPIGALIKQIRIALQVQNVSQNLVLKHFGSDVSVSPIVTLEPRRRKFHKPITIKMPLPKSMTDKRASQNVMHVDTLRLLCSYSGQNTATVWDDITGTSLLTVNQSSVTFITTISSRLWLIDCNRPNDVVKMATSLYAESCIAPFIGQFLVYCRRHSEEECIIRCIYITDDSEHKTLECQENFELIYTSLPIEILENHTYWLESSGNIIPVTKQNDQFSLKITPFEENRLSFTLRLKDPSEPPHGKLAFMEEPRRENQSTGSHYPNRPICTMDIKLPTEIFPLTIKSPGSLRANNFDCQKKKTCPNIMKSDLNVREIADKLGGDWPKLLRNLEVDESEINKINCLVGIEEDRAFEALLLWISTTTEEYKGNRLEQSLREIGREDIVKSSMHTIDKISDEEHNVAESSLKGRDGNSSISLTSDQEDNTHRAQDQIVDEYMVKRVHERPVVNDASVNNELSNDEMKQIKLDKYLELVSQLDELLPDAVLELEALEKNDRTQYDSTEVANEVDVVPQKIDRVTKTFDQSQPFLGINQPVTNTTTEYSCSTIEEEEVQNDLQNGKREIILGNELLATNRDSYDNLDPIEKTVFEEEMAETEEQSVNKVSELAEDVEKESLDDDTINSDEHFKTTQIEDIEEILKEREDLQDIEDRNYVERDNIFHEELKPAEIIEEQMEEDVGHDNVISTDVEQRIECARPPSDHVSNEEIIDHELSEDNIEGEEETKLDKVGESVDDESKTFKEVEEDNIDDVSQNNTNLIVEEQDIEKCTESCTEEESMLADDRNAKHKEEEGIEQMVNEMEPESTNERQKLVQEEADLPEHEGVQQDDIEEKYEEDQSAPVFEGNQEEILTEFDEQMEEAMKSDIQEDDQIKEFDAPTTVVNEREDMDKDKSTMEEAENSPLGKLENTSTRDEIKNISKDEESNDEAITHEYENLDLDRDEVVEDESVSYKQREIEDASDCYSYSEEVKEPCEEINAPNILDNADFEMENVFREESRFEELEEILEEDEDENSKANQSMYDVEHADLVREDAAEEGESVEYEDTLTKDHESNEPFTPLVSQYEVISPHNDVTTNEMADIDRIDEAFQEDGNNKALEVPVELDIAQADVDAQMQDLVDKEPFLGERAD